MTSNWQSSWPSLTALQEGEVSSLISGILLGRIYRFLCQEVFLKVMYFGCFGKLSRWDVLDYSYIVSSQTSLASVKAL